MTIGGELNRDRFAAVIGTPFTLTSGDGKTVVIELVEVSEMRLLPNQASYSILFQFPERYPVQQGLYELRHTALGKLQLFLVPVITPANQIRLEAVFNFLIPNGTTTEKGG